jgi:hypothetical protein
MGQFIPPESNGTVHDSVGVFGNNPGNLQFLTSNGSIPLNQTVTISMPNPQTGRQQGVLGMNNTIQITPQGANISFGRVQSYTH